jgi:hypothetical protein
MGWNKKVIFILTLSMSENDRDIKAILIDCNDCGHCLELQPPKDSDSKELKDARDEIRAIFDKWVKY